MNRIKLIITLLFLSLIVSCGSEVITTVKTTTDEISTTVETSTEISTTTTEQQLPIELQNCGNPYLDDFTIVWCDEFNYTGAPDSTKWKYDIGAGGWGNGELQHYTSREENAVVSNGYLTIAAIKEDYFNSEYTSARLVSKGNGSFKYGRVEIRAKLPKGRGTWTALWMLPTESVYGGWPDSGEIDIAEHVGYREGTIYGTIHTEKYNHKLGTQQGGDTVVGDATSEYHVYALEWYPRELRYFVDDELYYTYSFDELNDSGSDYHSAWPFDQAFHLIMNIAIGGSWGGAQGIDSNLIYTEMLIDYVRVYQQDYTKDDHTKPSIPQLRLDKTIISSKTANIIWYPSIDNQHIKQYQVFVNNEFVDYSFSSGYQLTGLQPNTNYNVSIKAEDFAGNLSDASHIEINTLALDTVPGIIEAEKYLFLSNGTLKESTEDSTLILTGIKKNDYIIYTFNVLEPGYYNINLRLSTYWADAGFAIYTLDENGNHLEYYGLTDIPATGGYDKWQTIQGKLPIKLTQGENSIKIFARSNKTGDIFWLNWLTLEISE